MGTKRSVIELVHDEGYGDSLLMHINLAFGSKDMRAERVVQSATRLLSALEQENIRVRKAVVSALAFLDMVAAEPSKPDDDSQLMASLMEIRGELRSSISSR